MPKLVRYCVLEEEHTGENVFLVHRPFVFGNPYTHIKNKETKALIKVATRDEAISLYEPYFDKMLKVDDNFKKEVPQLKDLSGLDKYKPQDCNTLVSTRHGSGTDGGSSGSLEGYNGNVKHNFNGWLYHRAQIINQIFDVINYCLWRAIFYACINAIFKHIVKAVHQSVDFCNIKTQFFHCLKSG